MVKKHHLLIPKNINEVTKTLNNLFLKENLIS